MYIAGWICLVVGILTAAIGWLLNTQTPIQQPLPIVGGALAVVGILILLAV
jgi:hypothetical protein